MTTTTPTTPTVARFATANPTTPTVARFATAPAATNLVGNALPTIAFPNTALLAIRV